MSSILNGVRWTEKRLTDEQLLLLEDAKWMKRLERLRRRSK